jgi:two-component system, OmpR family, KDP operon response regulator KdpE
MEARRSVPWLRRVARLLRGKSYYSVLLVDNDISAAQALASMLGDEFHVTIVGGLHDALISVVDQAPVLVVTELDLPDGSGLDVLRALRARTTVRTPLLMVVSARKGVDDKVAAFQAGADDYLVKPVDPATFLTEVKRLSYFAQALLPG